MAVIMYFLVILNALVLPLSQAQVLVDKCSSDIKGRKTDYVVELGTAVMHPGIETYHVDIPNVCGGGTVGVLLIACDQIAPPKPLITSFTSAYVKRTDTSLPGYVTGSVYCKFDMLTKQSKPVLAVKGVERQG